MHQYARRVVGLLNTAAELGFSAGSTEVIMNPLNSDMTAPWPSLEGAETGSKVLSILLPPAEDFALRRYATETRTDPDERIRRALRLGNHIVELTGTINTLDFKHKNQRVRIRTHTHQGRTAFADGFEDPQLEASYKVKRARIIETALRIQHTQRKR
jgi:hypothetical protein